MDKEPKKKLELYSYEAYGIDGPSGTSLMQKKKKGNPYGEIRLRNMLQIF